MAYTYIDGAEGYGSGSGTNIATTTKTLDVQAGDLLVVWVAHETQSGGTVTCGDGGSNTFAMEAETEQAGYNWGAFGLVVSASANAAATVTASFSNSVAYRCIAVMQFRQSTSGVTSVADQQATNTGTGTSMASTAFSTTGTGEWILLGAAKNYNTQGFTSPQIGGANADGSLLTGMNNLAGMWYRITSSTVTSATATATGANANWVCNAFSVKGTTGGGQAARSSVYFANNW